MTRGPTLWEMAEEPVQEPVQEPAFHGFMSADGTRIDLCFTPSAPRSDGTYATAYYTAPPQRLPLKKEQLLYIYNQLPNWGMDMDSLPQGLEKFARAVEAAHGIKEGT